VELTIDRNSWANGDPAGWLVITPFWMCGCCAATLVASAVVFGLAHFNKRAVFNWRYVILAAIAGVFYGRAFLENRRQLSAGITHATVDTVWSIWLR